MRRAAVLLLTALVILTGLAMGPLATAAPGDASPATRFSACFTGQGSGDVVVLMDESGSLKWTDTQQARVVAGRFLIERLATMAGRAGGDLNVLLAGFGTQYFDHGNDWTGLSPDTLPLVLAQMDAFTDRNTEQGTDYWLGLEGARAALAERQGEGPQRCQAIIFLSDGELDVQPASDYDRVARPYAPGNSLATRADRAAATGLAAESMCRPGGLADQVRSQGILIFGVGLQGPEDLEHPPPPDQFDLMQGVVTGHGPSETCGAMTDPTPGQFTLARDIDDLLFAFDGAVNPEPPAQAPICQEQRCPEGSYTIVLDRSVGGVDVLGSTDAQGITVELRSPSGATFSTTAGTPPDQGEHGLPGVEGHFRWLSPKSFTIRLESADPAAWAGAWTLTFIDRTGQSPDGMSRTSIHVEGDLVPTWTPPAEPLRIGDTWPLALGIADGKGQAVDPASLLGQSGLGVWLVDASAAARPLAEGIDKADMGVPVELDATELPAGTYTLRLRLDVTTAGTQTAEGVAIAGTRLTPKVRDFPFELRLPNGYPTVGQRLHLGHAEGPVRLEGALQVTGPGCVWVDAAGSTVTTRPEGIQEATLASTASDAASCVRLQQGEQASVPVTLTSPQTGNGAVNGTVAAVLVQLEEPTVPKVVQVPFTAEVSKPVDSGRWGLGLAAALVLGVGIPIALMYLYKFLFASRIPASPVVPTLVDIEVRGEQVLRDGVPLDFRPGDDLDLRTIAGSGTRSLAVGDCRLRAVMGPSPFGAGHVVVDAAGRVGVSDWDHTPRGASRSASLPLIVQNHWVLLVTPGVCDRAQLLLLTGTFSSETQKADLAADARRHVPGLVREHCASPTAPRPASTDAPQPPTPAAPDEPFDPFA